MELYQKAMDTALSYLETRMRSRKEVTDRLRRGQFEPDVIEKVLERLSELKLIDDAEFAGRWVASRAKPESSRSIGKKRLQNELIAKGISKEQVENAVERITDDDELALALKAAEKKARNRPADRDELFAQRRKLAGFLQRRGFNWDICKKVIDRLLPAEENY
jgi:regulatory protein